MQRNRQGLYIISTILIVLQAQQIKGQQCIMKGCKDPQYNSLNNQCICSLCQEGFKLTSDQQCSSVQCQQNNQYLYSYLDKNSLELQGCTSICAENQLPSDNTSICNPIFQCTKTFTQNSQTNKSRSILFVLYSQNDNLVFLVYDVFINAIDSQQGSFKKTYNFDNGVSSLIVIDNRLYLLNISAKQILEWDPYLSQAILVTQIRNGDLKPQSQIFRFININKYLISSFDNSNKVIFLSEVSYSTPQGSSFASVTLSSLFETLYTYENYLLLQKQDDFKVKIIYVRQNQNSPQLVQLSNDYTCENILGKIIDSKSLTFQNAYIFFLIFENTSSIFIQTSINQTYTCISIPTAEAALPQQLSIIQVDFCNKSTIQNILIVKLSNFKLNAYLIQQQNLLEYFEVVLDQAIVDFTPVVNSNELLLYLIDNKSAVQIYSIKQYQCIPQVLVNVKPIKQFSFQLIAPQRFYSFQKLTSQLKNQQVILSSLNTQIIFPSHNQSYLLVRDFKDKVFTNEQAVAKVIYLENAAYIASCSTEGKVIVWKASDPLSPKYAYTIKRIFPCLDILEFQDVFVVARFAYEVAIFNILNPLQIKSYYIKSPTLFSSISVTKDYVYIFCDQSAYVLSAYDAIAAISQKEAFPAQFQNVKSIFVPLNNKIIVYTLQYDLAVYDFDTTTKLINGNKLYKYQNIIPIITLKLFNIATGGKQN